MGYSAGTLDLSILGTSNEAIASIEKTVKALNSLSRAITKIYNLPILGASNNLAMFFQQISSATSKIDTAKIKNLATSVKGLSSISNLTKLDKMNWGNISSGFESLTTAITPFLAKVKEAEASLNSLYGILNKSSGKKINSLINNSGTGGSKNSGGLAGLFKLGKVSMLLYTFRRVGNVMGEIVTAGSDFGETLNLWQTSMGEKFLPQATEFVNKLNEAYGISKETLMNSQAIFKNMLGSLGQISDAQAYQLSEGVTQMALDYASLYNVQFDEAMTKFQAALAGQVRPIRSVSGYDITENTLYQLYQELGGTKSMRQLSRTEKQLLSIYAVFEQMQRSGATGDLRKTIESFANQSRVMAESWSDIKTYAGLIVTRTLQQKGVMQKINAMLIFVSRVLEGIANTIKDDYSVPQDVFSDITESADGATDAVDELNKSLLDFDKFRALDSNNTDIASTLGIDQKLINAIDQYNSLLSNVDMEATELADKWIEKLGGITNVVEKIKEFFQIIKDSEAYQFGVEVWETFKKIADILGDSEGGIFCWISMLNDTMQGMVGNNGPVAVLHTIAQWFNDEFLDDSNLTLIKLLTDGLNQLTEAINYLTGAQLLEDLGLLQILQDILDGISRFFDGFRELFELLQSSGLGRMVSRYINQYANDAMFADGGLPDKGTMFVAGESGAEMVYNMPSGQSGVANIQQIAQATYQGTMSALRDWWGGQNAKGDIPHLQEASATGLYEAVTGVAGSYGNTWSRI